VISQFVLYTINIKNDASMSVLDDHIVMLLIVASFTIEFTILASLYHRPLIDDLRDVTCLLIPLRSIIPS